jgi:hypothetical protein
MKITNHRGAPKKYDFLLKKGEYRIIKDFTKAQRDIVYKTAKSAGYKVVTRVKGDDLEIERGSM